MEEGLQTQIMQKMLEEGVSSVKLPGLAQVVRTNKTHYEIVDREAFARAIFEELKTADAEGRSLMDAFFAQFRVSKETFTELYADVTDVSRMGMALVEKPELSIRKA